jgi:hypothetical protein
MARHASQHALINLLSEVSANQLNTGQHRHRIMGTGYIACIDIAGISGTCSSGTGTNMRILFAILLYLREAFLRSNDKIVRCKTLQ